MLQVLRCWYHPVAPAQQKDAQGCEVVMLATMWCSSSMRCASSEGLEMSRNGMRGVGWDWGPITGAGP